MVITEAFAAATPVVASDIPGYRDVAARRGRRSAGRRGRRARAGRGAAQAGARSSEPRTDGARRARARRALCLDARRRGSVRLLRAGDRDRRAIGPTDAVGGSAGLRVRRPAAARSGPASALAARPTRRAAACRRAGHGACGRCVAPDWRRARSPVRGLAAVALQRVGVAPSGRIAARVQAGVGRRGRGADVRGDVRARAVLARDTRGRADLA